MISGERPIQRRTTSRVRRADVCTTLEAGDRYGLRGVNFARGLGEKGKFSPKGGGMRVRGEKGNFTSIRPSLSFSLSLSAEEKQAI